MKLRFPIATLLLTATALPGVAQLQPRGVLSGYVLDTRAGALRPLLGMPGAARLGEPVALQVGVADAVVRGDRAVVISNEQPPRAYLVRDLSRPEPGIVLLDGAIDQPDRVFLNSAGSTALLYSSAQGVFQFVTQLDATPRYFPVVAAVEQGRFLTAALADEGTRALIAGTDQDSGYVQLIGNSTGTQASNLFQQPGFEPVALSWLRQDRDAVVADRAGNQLLLFRDFVRGAAPIVLATADDGVNLPVALFPVSPTTVMVANGASPSLLLADTGQASPPRAIELPATPSRLEPPGAPGVVACNRAGPAPLLLVDVLHDFTASFVPLN